MNRRSLFAAAAGAALAPIAAPAVKAYNYSVTMGAPFKLGSYEKIAQLDRCIIGPGVRGWKTVYSTECPRPENTIRFFDSPRTSYRSCGDALIQQPENADYTMGHA